MIISSFTKFRLSVLSWEVMLFSPEFSALGFKLFDFIKTLEIYCCAMKLCGNERATIFNAFVFCKKDLSKKTFIDYSSIKVRVIFIRSPSRRSKLKSTDISFTQKTHSKKITSKLGFYNDHVSIMPLEVPAIQSSLTFILSQTTLYLLPKKHII